MILHVVNHGTYHRGNITAMLRQMGYASVPTDYGIYLYINKSKQDSQRGCLVISKKPNHMSDLAFRYAMFSSRSKLFFQFASSAVKAAAASCCSNA